MLFSEPKIPQCRTSTARLLSAVSVLFSEPKIPQCTRFGNVLPQAVCVSVLFSEPKIPQLLGRTTADRGNDYCFSALQRAENSSIVTCVGHGVRGQQFQCSSASRKFLNFLTLFVVVTLFWVSVLFSEPKIPQSRCSSHTHCEHQSFSALQRAENSSICASASRRAW